MTKIDTTWKTLALCSISAMAGILLVLTCGAGPGSAKAAGSASAGGTSPVIAYLAMSDHDGDGTAGSRISNDVYNKKGRGCPKGWTYVGWRMAGEGFGEAACLLK